MTFGRKALACLRFSALPIGSDERADARYAAENEFSEKAVAVKCVELAERGYIEYGVAATSGWLTDKGRQALKENES